MWSQMGGSCRVVKFHRGGSATNRATLSSLLESYIFFWLWVHLFIAKEFAGTVDGLNSKKKKINKKYNNQKCIHGDILWYLTFSFSHWHHKIWGEILKFSGNCYAKTWVNKTLTLLTFKIINYWFMLVIHNLWNSPIPQQLELGSWNCEKELLQIVHSESKVFF